LSISKTAILVGIATIGIAIPGYLYSKNQPVVTPVDSPVQSVSDQQDDLAQQRTKGSPDAPMTMYEFADFQCPACKMLFDNTIGGLTTEYIETGKLKLIFLNFPIPQIHANAGAAHEFAMCAAYQDKFWPIHDLLFSTQERWHNLDDPSAFFGTLAESARLNSDSLNTCIQTGLTRALIEAEFNAARRAGIQSTPSLVLEGGLLAGAVPLEALRPILDSIYAERTN
jgi:protein-disulfide isomerase